MSNTIETEAATIASIARNGMQPIINPAIPDAIAPLVFWPNHKEVTSLENFMPHPARQRATVNLTDYQSFIAYVNDFKRQGTRLFCELSPTGGVFTAIMDYHHASVGAAIGNAQWGLHNVTLRMQHAPEWINWTAKSGKPMDQLTMAQFLEENRLDIKMPDAATIIEIAQTFEATQGVNFKSALRQQSGDRALAYEVQTGAKAGEKGQLTIPEKIGLSLQVFQNGPEYPIDAFFRYDIGGGALKLRYELIRPHKFVELALAEARNAIAEQTSLPLHSGTARTA